MWDYYLQIKPGDFLFTNNNKFCVFRLFLSLLISISFRLHM